MTGFEQEKIITRSSLLTCRIGMKRVLNSTPESFVTDVGIRVRRKIFRLLQKPLYLAAGKKIILERYPDLEPDKPYIFTSNHWFAEDFIAVLSCLDRNAFILFGSRDQVEHNPAMIFPWLNGIVFVDRMNKASRRDSVLKMVRLLNNGTSILLFPEGTYNSSENLLCLKLFPGPYTLNQETGVPVIPIAVYTLPELTSIYVNFGNPMDFGSMGQAEAMELLRDTLASMHYEHIIKYGGTLTRDKLIGDYHLEHMVRRRMEHMKQKWSRDVWDEELMEYTDRTITEAKTVRAELNRVAITPANAHILAPILVRHEEDVRYDFKHYMKETWDKE